jgi:hypothetical protein
MFHSMGTKVFPRVAWTSLMAGNVTNWRQSMSGFSGVAYPGLKLVGGIITLISKIHELKSMERDPLKGEH